MRSYTHILVIIFMLSISFSYTLADITKQEMSKAIIQNLRHPYLYFTEEEKPVILDRIKKNPECNDIMRHLIAEANHLLYSPIDSTQIGTRNKTLLLAFVYQMTDDEKYAVKGYEYVKMWCDRPQWVSDFHSFPVIYDRVWPWNVPDDQVVFSFGHSLGYESRMIATVYDWLYPALDKYQRNYIRCTLLEKAITRVRGNYEFHWWSTAYRCNWCSLCFSGLGVAALALLTEDPQLVDVVAESYNRIGKVLDEFGIDGGWQEGLAYWHSTVSPCMYFAEPLKRLTNGKYNLFKHPRLAKNPITFPLYNYIPPHKAVNFADSYSWRYGYSYTFNKLATETKNREAAWYRENLIGKGADLWDIIWPKSMVKPGLPIKTSFHFRTIDWAVMRSDFTDTEKVIVACKAGYNDDPHHGHLDCGHFIVFWRGEGFITESYRVMYERLYFNEERWNFPGASSIGHNVVFVNGETQIPAKFKNKSWKEGIGGKILDFRTTHTRDYTLMDPSGAYPGKELKGWRRHIILEKPLITVILDEVKSDRGADIETRFHSEVTQHVMDRYLLLDGNNGDMALIPIVVDGEFAFKLGKHAVKPFERDDDFKWIPYCDTFLKAKSENTVIGNVILPIENEDEAQDIVQSVKRTVDRSGNLSLSFTRKGEIYTYKFKKNRDGLILEE